MRKINKKAVILLYVLFLLNIALILGFVVSNNLFIYNNNLETDDISVLLRNNINEKKDLIFKLADYYNSNGSGFVDNVSCPINVTMSGTVNKSTGLVTELIYQSGSIFCSGSYLGDNFVIDFKNDFSGFSGAIYKGDSVLIVGGVGDSLFLDDDTLISNVINGPTDNYDDNFNSDNYNVSSTGVNYYPFSYIDDDSDHRKKLFGYIKPNNTFYNIFWNNKNINNIININTNNNEPYNSKLGNVSSGVVFLDFSMPLDIKLVQFDKDIYEKGKTLLPVNTYNGSLLTGSGYLSFTGNTLKLEPLKNGDEFSFDFTNNDYGIFLRNNSSTDYVEYTIKSETESGTGIYIAPINDSIDTMEYLGNDIMIDNDGIFIAEEFITKQSK